MKSRRISLLIILVVLLVLTFFQVVDVAAQGSGMGTGGLIGLGTLTQIVRLMLGKAFVYSFGG